MNRTGDLRATKHGDLTYALSERIPALADVKAGCAGPSPTGVDDESRDAGVVSRAAVVPSLARRAYLQRVTATTATLVWTTPRTIDAPTVVVARPDGISVATMVGTVDPSARPPANGVQWLSEVEGLTAGALYCYRLRAGAEILQQGGFRTSPAPGNQGTVSFVALGDSGSGGSDQKAVYEQMLTVPIDLFLHLGDIAYESGTRGELESRFFDIYAGLLASVPVFPVSGNHEYETEEAAPFREAFVLPENGGPGGIERWYAYDWGDVHFVALDTEQVNPVQAGWLAADLSANQRPVVIVTMHRPPFSSGDHGDDSNVQRHFVPLFAKHKVALVLSGHEHHYERFKPLAGVTYVVSGGGGRGTRPVGRSSFTAFSESVSHFLYVTVRDNVLTGHAIDGTGQEFDSFRITR
jgi:hypothetical protein